MNIVEYILVGIPTPLKNMKVQLGLFFPIYGKIKNVPNHQPDRDARGDADENCEKMRVWHGFNGKTKHNMNNMGLIGTANWKITIQKIGKSTN